jgi:hypothetical protein
MTHATLLLADGIRVKVVSGRLGHASPTVYQHMHPGMGPARPSTGPPRCSAADRDTPAGRRSTTAVSRGLFQAPTRDVRACDPQKHRCELCPRGDTVHTHTACAAFMTSPNQSHGDTRVGRDCSVGRRKTPRFQNGAYAFPVGNIGKEVRRIEVLPVPEPTPAPASPEQPEPQPEPAPAR